MKANELRIGNLIHVKNYDAKWCKVIVIGKYKIGHEGPTADHNENEIEDIEPIPLKEDILLKCRFVKQNSMCFTLNDFFISYYSDDNNKVYLDRFIYNVLNFSNESEIEIKYLHQLQNLYFALTNQELIFNYGN